MRSIALVTAAVVLTAMGSVLILSCPGTQTLRISGEFRVTHFDDSNFNYHVIGLESAEDSPFILLSERVFLDVDTLSPGCSPIEVGNTYELSLEERVPAPQLWTLPTYNDLNKELLSYRVKDVLGETSGDTALLMNLDHSFRVKVYRSRDVVDKYLLVEGDTCEPCEQPVYSAHWLIQEAISSDVLEEYFDEYWVDDSSMVLCVYGDCLQNHSLDWLAWDQGVARVMRSSEGYANSLEFLVLELDGREGHVVFDYSRANIRCDLTFLCWGWGWTLLSSEIRELQR